MMNFWKFFLKQKESGHIIWLIFDLSWPWMTSKRSDTCPTSFEEMFWGNCKIELHRISRNSCHDFFRERRSLLHWEDLSCQCTWYGRKMASRSWRKHAQVRFHFWLVQISWPMRRKHLKTLKATFVGWLWPGQKIIWPSQEKNGSNNGPEWWSFLDHKCIGPNPSNKISKKDDL